MNLQMINEAIDFIELKYFHRILLKALILRNHRFHNDPIYVCHIIYSLQCPRDGAFSFMDDTFKKKKCFNIGIINSFQWFIQ